MFDKPFKINCLGRNTSASSGKKHLLCEHLFSFRDERNGTRYIITMEEYNHKVFEVSFCRKSELKSKRRFNILTGLYSNGPGAARVIRTCIEAMIYFYRKDASCSFFFVGAAGDEESLDNSKKYRLYGKIMKNLFSPATFSHYERNQTSTYLLLNKSQENEHADFAKTVWDMICDVYDVDHIDL